MDKKNILITGGAGFVGSFLSERLLRDGHFVRIYDNLETQVHLSGAPSYLPKTAHFIQADMRDYDSLSRALIGIDVVYHLAARVGVAQSNYQIKEYIDTNIAGMGNILDVVVNKKLPVRKILMTASMTSYGEGCYHCSLCGDVKASLRTEEQMQKKQWEPFCPICAEVVLPIATSEKSELMNNSVYSITKNVQESLLMHIGKMYNLPVVSLRCFNIYGPRQSLSNPYTGVAAIFLSRLQHDKPAVIYEDGGQTRDFISVHDVVDALVLSMETDKADYQCLNIGSGSPVSILDIAKTIGTVLGKDISPQITGEFRKNDIRHCFADISLAKSFLGWEPKVALSEGMRELIEWSKHETSEDLFDKAASESRAKGLIQA